MYNKNGNNGNELVITNIASKRALEDFAIELIRLYNKYRTEYKEVAS